MEYRRVALVACIMFMFDFALKDCSAVYVSREQGSSLLHRSRRDTVQMRNFVVSKYATGNLFSVASIPSDPSETFQFATPVPGLSISGSGIVSLNTGSSLPGTPFTSINISRNSTNGEYLKTFAYD